MGDGRVGDKRVGDKRVVVKRVGVERPAESALWRALSNIERALYAHFVISSASLEL